MNPLESLLEIFIELHPEDAARAFESLNAEEGLHLFCMLPVRVAVPLVEQLSPVAATPLLERMDEDRIRQLILEMPPREASSLIHLLSESRRESVLDGLDPAQAKPLRELAMYPSGTAGEIMEPRVASLAIDMTVGQVIAKLRETPREALHYLYVVSRSGKLIGVLTMRDLLLGSPNDRIEPMVKRTIVSVIDTMDREDVVNLMRERKFFALPVVDFDGRLVGVVKHHDVLEAGQLEAFEDMQILVGAGADERALSPVRTVVKSRLPWLFVNLGATFLAATVIGLFEDMISRIAALAVLLPVVAGLGGNTGLQSLAVVMRGLALREIIPSVKKRVILKELLGGVLNGLMIAAVTAISVFVWRMVAGDTLTGSLALSAVIGIAMIVNMALAALAGATIPMILSALGRDPAQSASIFLTTVTDIAGFAAFLGLASLFVKMIGV